MPPTVFPTGVTIHDPEKAFGCYVLFDGHADHTYVIDMNGNVVHTWDYAGWPSEMIDPAHANGAKGNVIVQKEANSFDNKTLLELDWDGNVVWEWGEKAPGGRANQEHDQARLPNGNTLVLAYLMNMVPELSDEPIRDEAIYEVTPEGDIVWTWISTEHMEELGITEENKQWLLSPLLRAKRTGVLALNNMAPLGPNKWFDAGDERFHPDNIMIDSRDGCFIAIIEKKTGGIVWRLGPELPATHDMSKRTFVGALPRPVDSISGQHDAHIIAPGLQGEGNILVFDNQGSAGFPPSYLEVFQGSRVLEIDPITKDIVWQYDGSCSGQTFWTFSSTFISSARRLPNGNTLICEGMHGRLFQVTREGEIVWEYVNPHFQQTVERDPNTPIVMNTWMTMARKNFVYRAQPIPYDWVPETTPRSATSVVPPSPENFKIG